MFRFQFIPWYGESLNKFEQVATGAPTENIYISAGSTPTTFHLIIVFYVGSQEYSIFLYVCFRLILNIARRICDAHVFGLES